MDGIRVKEKLNNLFETISTIKQLTIFDFLPATSIDKYYVGMFGNRVLSSMGNDFTVEDLAQIVIDFYGTKWENILLQYTSSIIELKEYNETIDETITDKGTNDLKRKNVNQVSAYNDENFVNDNQDDETSLIKLDNTKTRVYAIKKIRDTPQYIDTIMYLRNNLLCDTIFKDINDLATLQIFD